MNPTTNHLMFMHVCIHHYTKASLLQSGKWILIALKNETHSPTAPSKTWLLPIFFFFSKSPHFLLPKILYAPKSLPSSLNMPSLSLLQYFAHAVVCFIPSLPSPFPYTAPFLIFCLNLNAPLKFFPSSFQVKKNHILRESFFFFTILISAYNDFVSLLCLCHHTQSSIKARNIYLSHYYILNSKHHAWLVHNKSSISVF